MAPAFSGNSFLCILERLDTVVFTKGLGTIDGEDVKKECFQILASHFGGDFLAQQVPFISMCLQIPKLRTMWEVEQVICALQCIGLFAVGVIPIQPSPELVPIEGLAGDSFSILPLPAVHAPAQVGPTHAGEYDVLRACQPHLLRRGLDVLEGDALLNGHKILKDHPPSVPGGGTQIHHELSPRSIFFACAPEQLGNLVGADVKVPPSVFILREHFHGVNKVMHIGVE